jgi:hypothetical protein
VVFPVGGAENVPAGKGLASSFFTFFAIFPVRGSFPVRSQPANTWTFALLPGRIGAKNPAAQLPDASKEWVSHPLFCVPGCCRHTSPP